MSQDGNVLFGYGRTLRGKGVSATSSEGLVFSYLNIVHQKLTASASYATSMFIITRFIFASFTPENLFALIK